MAAELINLDYATRFERFSIDSESDLNSLPKINVAGKDNLSTIDCVSQGSMAYCTDGKDYILNGSNKWVRYIPVDNSISEYNKVLGSFAFEFYMTNIDIYEYEGMYFGTANFLGAPTYDYIYKVADIIARKNNESTTDVLKTDLVEKTYGIIHWIRRDSSVFSFFNTTITSIKYNKETTDSLGATASVQFCSTVPLSSITTNNTNTTTVAVSGGTIYTCYPFKGIVTVVSQ